MTNPEQFASMGTDLATTFIQIAERLRVFTAAFEARGGMDQFEDAKAVAIAPDVLTPAQVAANAELDRMANNTLEIIYLNNDLQAFLVPAKLATLNRVRTDY